MCAICGIINFNNQHVSEQNVLDMRDAMVNRGPDAGGVQLIDPTTCLGHRRLKIIDLSDEANQPMCNEDEQVWTVFNGEIYNFASLREELLQLGHHFKTNSDTEVIVHGYEAWREGLFTRLEGMFAIAIWDQPNRQLWLARDRYGKKPLFYQLQDGQICFASEIKALWKISDVALPINHRAVDCYLHHFSPTQDHCIFQGIEKVRPGHYVCVDSTGIQSTRYFKPSFQPKKAFKEEEAIDEIEAVLLEAVQKRLISDVPLGAFLSGGIDSSLIVGMMAKVTKTPVKTFSIGFEEQDYSELHYAKAVAEHCHTDHKEIILKPNVLEVLPSLVYEYGEPFADSSAVPSYFVAKAAREHVTVVLSGDGGDEQFGGYDIARASYYAHRLATICPSPLRTFLERYVFHPNRIQSPNRLIQKLRTLLVHTSSHPEHRHAYTMAFASHEKNQLYTQDFRESLNQYHPSRIFESYSDDIKDLHLIDQNLFLTLVSKLPNDFLIKVDVASMKSSLELRCPFLDPKVGELAGSIEPELKVKGGVQKYLLKKLAERYVPKEIIYRQKRGFEIPITHWLRGDWQPVFQGLVLERGSLQQRNWVQMDYVESIFQEHIHGKVNHAHRLWSLLWLEIWLRLFVDKSMQPDDSLESMTKTDTTAYSKQLLS